LKDGDDIEVDADKGNGKSFKEKIIYSKVLENFGINANERKRT